MKPSPHHVFVAAVGGFCAALFAGLVGALFVIP